MRKLLDGTIIFPVRGKPPVIPPGYVTAPGNPYILKPSPPPCTHREIRQPNKRCCNQANWIHCKLFSKRVTNGTCRSCDEATG